MRHHGAGLLRATRRAELVTAITTGEVPPDFSERDKLMIDYCIKLTRHPSLISSADVALLRDHGFSDRAILEVNLAAAYMNFVNRVALGMGVEPEGKMEEFTR